MKKYIDADKLKKYIERKRDCVCDGLDWDDMDECQRFAVEYLDDILSFVTSLQQKQEDMGEVSDGYHTFNELYYYRMLYNAAFFNLLPKGWVHKSKRHHTGEECFGGGWFIVMANLPTGQVSNHYELKDWDLFKVPEKEFADEWDGHTHQEAAERIKKYLQFTDTLEDKIKRATESWKGVDVDKFMDDVRGREQQDQPEVQNGKFVFPKYLYARTKDNKTIDMSYAPQDMTAVEYIRNDSIEQEQPEVDLEKDIDAFFDKWDKNSNGAIFDENGARVTIETIKGAVKHFLNARKEESK